MSKSVEQWRDLFLIQTKNEGKELTDKSSDELTTCLATFKKGLAVKYKKLNRNVQKIKEDNWAKEMIILDLEFQDFIEKKGGPGAPKKGFDDCAPNTQRKRLKETTEEKSLNELILAVIYKARQEKKNDLVHIVSEIQKDSSLPARIKEFISPKKKIEITNYTPDEAAALISEHSLSERVYKALRLFSENKFRQADSLGFQ